MSDTADATDLDPAILDDGLWLAMEWGEAWLTPIVTRLSALHPNLSAAQLDRYDAVCRAAMTFGHRATNEALTDAWHEHGWHDLDDVDTSLVIPAFVQAVRDALPWVSDRNLERLFSQGMYYALK